MLLQLSHFPPSACTPPPTRIPPFSSCPWVTHVSSSASTFSTLFLTSPSVFIYHLCFLFPEPFPPFSPLHLPTDNPSYYLLFCDSIPLLLVAYFVLVFVVFLGLVVDSCEFAVISLLIFFIFFFLDKTL